MPRSPPRALLVLSGSADPFRTPGQRPVTPRYRNGAEDNAKQAPTAERRDAPRSRSNAPTPNAIQFSASANEGDRSFGVSAFIDVVENSMLRTSAEGSASHLLEDLGR